MKINVNVNVNIKMVQEKTLSVQSKQSKYILVVNRIFYMYIMMHFIIIYGLIIIFSL